MTSEPKSHNEQLVALADALIDYYRGALDRAENRVRRLDNVRWAAELLYVVLTNRDGGQWIGEQPEFVREAVYRLSNVLKADADHDNGGGR